MTDYEGQSSSLLLKGVRYYLQNDLVNIGCAKTSDVLGF